MRRPLPTLPHGPRRRRAAAPPPKFYLLACPKVSPEWELGALRALMKPHDWTRGAIAHAPALQRLPAGAAGPVDETSSLVAARLGWPRVPRADFPGDGDFWFVIEFPGGQLGDAMALAAVLSGRMPGLWLTLDRLYLRDGRFFRRKRSNTFKIRIVPAPGVHLSRDFRAALRSLLVSRERRRPPAQAIRRRKGSVARRNEPRSASSEI